MSGPDLSGTYLGKILGAHREAAALDHRDLDELLERVQVAPEARGFAHAIKASTGLAVIAEIKRRSPSKGVLVTDLDAIVMARTYERANATCLSVLTDVEHFGGSRSDFIEARSAVSIPALRKDFTVSPNDVCDARAMGADCVLLIAAALDDAELRDFHALALLLGMDALVEVHDEAEANRALEIGATLIGVNQRDLRTFEVDTQRAIRVASQLPSDIVRVAESGVRNQDDAVALAAAGYDAVLVGESLLIAEDTALALAELQVG